MIDKEPLAKKDVLKRLMRGNTNYRNRMDKIMLLKNETDADKEEERVVYDKNSNEFYHLYRNMINIDYS